MTLDYAAACIQAATDQGLDPATIALQEAGFPCEVEQTGGMMMVLVAPDPRDLTYVFTITSEGIDHLYLIVRQPKSVWFGDEGWSDDDPRVTVLSHDAPAAKVVEIVGGRIRAGHNRLDPYRYGLVRTGTNKRSA